MTWSTKKHGAVEYADSPLLSWRDGGRKTFGTGHVPTISLPVEGALRGSSHSLEGQEHPAHGVTVSSCRRPMNVETSEYRSYLTALVSPQGAEERAGSSEMLNRSPESAARWMIKLRNTTVTSLHSYPLEEQRNERARAPRCVDRQGASSQPAPSRLCPRARRQTWHIYRLWRWERGAMSCTPAQPDV